MYSRILPIILLALAYAIESAAADFDIIFRGGEVMDGTGAEPIRADVGVVGDRIQQIGDLSGAEAKNIVDVTGKLVTPGFIDLHSHADGGSDSGGLRSNNPRRRAAPNLVSQGITTVVVNQDGRSPANIRRQRAQLEERGFGPNVVLMVGHNTVRQMAMIGSNRARPATDDELTKMRRFVRAGMEAGAYGLTAGLEYVPGRWSTTGELIALVREIVPYDGVYIVHERGSGADPMWYLPSRHDPEQPSMLDSVLETIAVGEATGATVVATHIKARGTNYWGASATIIKAIEQARDRGVHIYADQYPYTSSGSDGVIVLLPRWITDLNAEERTAPARDYATLLRQVLRDPALAADVNRDVAHEIARRGGPDNIVIFNHPNKDYIGRTLADVATELSLTPVEMVYRLQLDGFYSRFGGAQLRGYSMSQDDVDAFAAQPWTATASDAGIALPEDGLVHARYYGTFPRKIRHYALDREVLPLAAAIRSMTALPAEIMKFEDRGLLKKGYAADVTVIDLDRVDDRATFFEPHQYAAGIDYVMINGTFVVEDGFRTLALPGRVLVPQRPELDSD